MPGPHADHWEIIGVWAERYDGIIFPVAVVSDFSIGCLFFFFLFKEKKKFSCSIWAMGIIRRGYHGFGTLLVLREYNIHSDSLPSTSFAFVFPFVRWVAAQSSS